MPDIGLAPTALVRRSALDRVARLPAGAGVMVSAVAPRERLVLQAGDTVADSAANALGLAFERRACHASVSGDRAALWLGPREWLVLAPIGAALAQTLGVALAGMPHSLVDVSHRQVGLVVEGPRAVELLAACCPLDLHMSAFPPGMCTRTIFCKAEIVLWRTGAERFHVEVWQSFASYLTGLLGVIAAEAA